MKLSRASIALLLIQLCIVSSIAAKYLYQRSTCPKVWTRAVAYDPELTMRGRYLSTQLNVDACGVQLPVATNSRRAPAIQFDIHGKVVEAGRYLSAQLAVKNGKLTVNKFTDDDPDDHAGQELLIRDTPETCAQSTLQKAVNLYISESAKSPFPLPKGSELWVEVTVPPKGPPRPIAMAIKDSAGHWQPLNYR